MVAFFVSLGFLLLFAELASANFKRLAPVLEAWDQLKKGTNGVSPDPGPFPWLGGWEKLAALVWALGASIPLLAFSLACYLFSGNRETSGNLVIGASLGSNAIALSVGFGLVLLSGPITFFRVRTITSPVFLLLATVVFVYTGLNLKLSAPEGLLLLFLVLAYGLYFRRFSSEWKHYERAFARKSLLESSEGLLPILALLCMGIGFFVLAILVAFPFVSALEELAAKEGRGAFRMGAHVAALGLNAPWLIRCFVSARAGTTSRAITLSSIGHACLLNVLLLPGLAALLGARALAPSLISIYLPAIFGFTGIFAASLMVEKEKGGLLPWILILFYLVFTGLGMVY